MLPAASALPNPPPSVSVPVMLIVLPVEPTQPALKPTYHPVQLKAQQGGGGAFAQHKSAAIAEEPMSAAINDAAAAMTQNDLFITNSQKWLTGANPTDTLLSTRHAY